MTTKTAARSITTERIRAKIVGLNEKVPTLSGALKPYINFDNAASTPPFTDVLDTVNQFMPWYSSVHRGSGFKSRLSSEAYEEARKTVGQFCGANAREHVVIFGKNATEAINKLSYRLNLSKDDIVLVGEIEHHSNDLPWRRACKTVRIGLDGQGNLDAEDLKHSLSKHGKKVKLVAISGGSNVTGVLPDIHDFARIAHQAGAQILVDCAQLAPHRRIDVKSLSDPGHLDYIALSAHKMYAPFGTGALIGRRDTFEAGQPEVCGGGTISVVTEDEVRWASAPERDEAGSPNVVGAVAMAKAIKCLQAVGMEKVAAHEAELTGYLLNKLSKIDGLKIYGDKKPANAASRLGVVTFNLADLHHSLVAAILSTEWAIGVRSGCFCAHPYVTKLLGLDEHATSAFKQRVIKGDRSSTPGMVRVSFGIYNTTQEIDTLCDALEQIAAGAFEGGYIQNKTTGEYKARGWQPQLANYFKL